MTNKPEPQPIGQRLEVNFENSATVPVMTPNVGRASQAGGLFYVDLGYVDPFEASEIGLKLGTSHSTTKVSAIPMVRLALSATMAEQIVQIISTQLQLSIEVQNEEG